MRRTDDSVSIAEVLLPDILRVQKSLQIKFTESTGKRDNANTMKSRIRRRTMKFFVYTRHPVILNNEKSIQLPFCAISIHQTKKHVLPWPKHTRTERRETLWEMLEKLFLKEQQVRFPRYNPEGIASFVADFWELIFWKDVFSTSDEGISYEG
eukprot:Polyplicarium_translucidae@DN3014_c0_g1_i3.p1